MKMTLGELKEFISDLPNDTEVVLQTVEIGEESYCSNVIDIGFHETYVPYHTRRLVLVPSEISVGGNDDDR